VELVDGGIQGGQQVAPAMEPAPRDERE
jgi:hypothetical protein